MPISIRATSEPGRAARERGFTLIELMIVIAIIGLLTSAVVLSIPGQRGKVLEDAGRFAARVAAARDDAVLQSRPMSLWVSASGYGFAERRGGRWLPSRGKPFGPTNWREGTVALLGPGAGARIWFDSTGLASQSLVVRLARGEEQVLVSIGVNGRVDVGG